MALCAGAVVVVDGAGLAVCWAFTGIIKRAEASKNELFTSRLFIFIPLKDFFHLALDAEKIGQYCKVADFARRLYAAILDSLTFAVDPHYWNIESAGRHHIMIIALSGVQPLLAFCSCSRWSRADWRIPISRSSPVLREMFRCGGLPALHCLS